MLLNLKGGQSVLGIASSCSGVAMIVGKIRECYGLSQVDLLFLLVWRKK